MTSLSRGEDPLRALRSPIPLQGAKALPEQLSEMVNMDGHPNIRKCWAAVTGSDGWATSEGFGQGIAPSLAQAAECCPEELSGVSLPSHGHPTLPLVWTSAGVRKPCDGDRTSQSQERWAKGCPGGGGLPYCWAFTTSKLLFYCVPHLPFPSCKVTSE